jgi:hypothetical protein
MQFLSVREPRNGVHRTFRDLGDRDYNASIRFRVAGPRGGGNRSRCPRRAERLAFLGR